MYNLYNFEIKMKKITLILILLICVVSCKKKETTKNEIKTTNITALDKTVTIMCQGSCIQGLLKVNWDYEVNAPLGTDSTYNYTMSSSYFTKVVQSDSIQIYFKSSTCGTCPPCGNNVTVTVDGIQKYIYSNSLGGYFINIKL